MPCGKKPFKKRWDKPRNLTVVKPSRYQKNLASVRVHWMNVINDLEDAYSEDQFWVSNYQKVRDLVGQSTFERLAIIFHLPLELDGKRGYVQHSEPSSIQPSMDFYEHGGQPSRRNLSEYSYTESDILAQEMQKEQSKSEESAKSEESQIYSGTSDDLGRTSSGKLATVTSSIADGKSSQSLNKSFSKLLTRSFSKFNKSATQNYSKRTLKSLESSMDLGAFTEDDMIVHASNVEKRGNIMKTTPLKLVNPHFEMLYCNVSETDMIKWNSKIYEHRRFEITASDEYGRRAEMLSKSIAFAFYDWWCDMGSEDYKSEIKRPEDIENLFQIWFDEHASQGLVLDPKILPCVTEEIAELANAPESACSAMLKRLIKADIKSETQPAHTTAFDSSLPHHMKHLPPNNNTAENWQPVKIPEDLRSMACVWGDIAHLTSTKAFQKWLQQRPHLPMPPCLKNLSKPCGRKSLFVVPSDYTEPKELDGISTPELALPVSEFTIEIKDVISKLLTSD